MEKSIWKMWHIMLGIGSITIMSSQSCTHLVQNIVKYGYNFMYLATSLITGTKKCKYTTTF